MPNTKDIERLRVALEQGRDRVMNMHPGFRNSRKSRRKDEDIITEALDRLILATPTGDYRNALTDVNILWHNVIDDKGEPEPLNRF